MPRSPSALPQEPAPNLSFVSQWGDALSKGDQTVWKRNLVTSYARGNREAWGARAAHTGVSLEGAGAVDKFYSLSRQLRLYYGPLFRDVPVDQVDEWLRDSSDAERRELLNVLGAMHVEVNTTNDKGYNFSTTYTSEYVPLRPSSAHAERALEAVLNKGAQQVIAWFKKHRPGDSRKLPAWPRDPRDVRRHLAGAAQAFRNDR